MSRLTMIRIGVAAVAFVCISAFFYQKFSEVFSIQIEDDICLDEKKFEESLSRMSKLIDTSYANADINTSTERPQLVEDHCDKKIYFKRDFRLVVSRRPGNEEEPNVSVQPRGTALSEESAHACLQKVEQDVAKIHFEAGIRALYNYKRNYPTYYEDADIGPVKWISCASSDSHSYWDSLPDAIHELSHDLRDEECLFPIKRNEVLCFKLDQDLPKRSLGKVEDLGTSDEERLRFLESAQKMYLTDTDQPVHMLFDELNSYTIATIGLITLLKERGHDNFYDSSGGRTAVILPLFMNMTANYLIRLNDDNRPLFSRNLLANQVNSQSLSRLLRTAEETFAEWDQVRKHSGVQEVDFESNLWKQYLTSKERLKALGLKL